MNLESEDCDAQKEKQLKSGGPVLEPNSGDWKQSRRHSEPTVSVGRRNGRPFFLQQRALQRSVSLGRYHAFRNISAVQCPIFVPQIPVEKRIKIFTNKEDTRLRRSANAPSQTAIRGITAKARIDESKKDCNQSLSIPQLRFSSHLTEVNFGRNADATSKTASAISSEVKIPSPKSRQQMNSNGVVGMPGQAAQQLSYGFETGQILRRSVSRTASLQSDDALRRVSTSFPQQTLLNAETSSEEFLISRQGYPESRFSLRQSRMQRSNNAISSPVSSSSTEALGNSISRIAYMADLPSRRRLFLHNRQLHSRRNRNRSASMCNLL